MLTPEKPLETLGEGVEVCAGVASAWKNHHGVGVTFLPTLLRLLPTALVACTLQVYLLPGVRPGTNIGDEAPLETTGVAAPAAVDTHVVV